MMQRRHVVFSCEVDGSTPLHEQTHQTLELVLVLLLALNYVQETYLLCRQAWRLWELEMEREEVWGGGGGGG